MFKTDLTSKRMPVIGTLLYKLYGKFHFKISQNEITLKLGIKI